MRGIVVGEFLADFQPGGQLSGGGNPLVHRCWVALRYRTLSRRRNRIHVGCACTGLGPAALYLSPRAPTGLALGHAQNWIRPSCPRIAGRDCRGTFDRLALFARGLQYELCLSRPSLSSLLGPAPAHLAVIFVGV